MLALRELQGTVFERGCHQLPMRLEDCLHPCLRQHPCTLRSPHVVSVKPSACKACQLSADTMPQHDFVDRQPVVGADFWTACTSIKLRCLGGNQIHDDSRCLHTGCCQLEQSSDQEANSGRAHVIRWLIVSGGPSALMTNSNCVTKFATRMGGSGQATFVRLVANDDIQKSHATIKKS